MRQRAGWEGAPESAWESPEAAGDYDALADLFLASPHGAAPAPFVAEGNGAPETRAAPSAHRNGAADEPRPPLSIPPTPDRSAQPPNEISLARLPVEALVLGHLPAMTGAWVTQHARATAEADGRPVALVRLTAGLASVELVGTGADADAQPSPTIEAAIGHAAACAGRFLVRVEATEEPGLCAAPGVDAITLLTGADEPAVVAAYAALKAIARPANADIADPTERAAPRVRVVFMGAAEAEAHAAGLKIAGAAEAFLGAPVECAKGVERIEPTASRSLYRGRANAPTRAIVAAVVAAAAAVKAPSAPTPRTYATGPAPGAPPSAVEAARPAEPLPRPAEDVHAGRSPLARLVTGLTPTPIALPDAEGVEIALDAEGRAHLLCEAGPRAVERLLCARAWIDRHAGVLALALRGAGCMRHEPAERPRMHLLCSDPAEWGALRHTDVRVRATIGGASVEVS